MNDIGFYFGPAQTAETAASDHDNAEASSGAQLTFDCAEVENVASDKKEESNGSPDTGILSYTSLSTMSLV